MPRSSRLIRNDPAQASPNRLRGAGEVRSGATLDALARWTAELIVGGARLLVCGDADSMARAQQFAGELSHRYHGAQRPLRALALSADGSLLACMDDYPADAIFARQVEGLGQVGDLLVVLSTRGAERILVAALESAQRAGLHTLVLAGQDGDALTERAERAWTVPGDEPACGRDAQLSFIQVVCALLDGALHVA